MIKMRIYHDSPIKKWWFPIATLNNQMVILFNHQYSGLRIRGWWVACFNLPAHLRLWGMKIHDYTSFDKNAIMVLDDLRMNIGW